MTKIALGAVLVLAWAAIPVPGECAGPSHAGHVKKYEGAASCTAPSCHEGMGREVAESLHYQQRGVPQFLEGWEAGKLAGMTETY